MEDIKIKICRLCLNIIENGHFNSGSHTEMIKTTLSEVDLQIINDADLCQNCYLKLEEFSSFKSTCLKNNEHIVCSIDAKITKPITLEGILKESSNDEQNQNKVCRFCLKHLIQKSYIILENSSDNLNTVITKCIPEIDIGLTCTSVSCFNCLNTFKNFYEFIKRCHDSEQKINTAIENLGKANLFQVFQYYLVKGNETQSSELKQQYEDNDSNLITKMELQCEENDLLKTYDEVEYIKKEDIAKFNLENDVFNSKMNVQTSDEVNNEISLQALLKHSNCEKVEMMIVYKCKECQFLSNSIENMETHSASNRNHGKGTMLHQCIKCPYQAELLRNLKKHMIKHKDPSEVRMYSCTQCTYQSKYKSGINAHIVSHKSPEELEVHSCDQCSFQTKLKDSLRKHRVIHKSNYKIKSFHCDQCLYIAKDRSRLKQHMLIHKTENEIEMFHCQHCPYRSKHKSALVSHMTHHLSPGEVKLHKCEACSYETRFKSHLQRHKQSVHSNMNRVEKFKCLQCPYQTKKKTNLTRHMVFHKKDDEVVYHQCHICSYKTKKKGSLMKHKLSHLNGS